MSIKFNGSGQGATPGGGFFQIMAGLGIGAGQVSASSSGSSGSFPVPIGPPQKVPTPFFGRLTDPTMPATQTITPTETNQEIKGQILYLQASDPAAYKQFEKDLEKSGYDSFDDLLYGAALVNQPWEEHMAQRVSSGLFGGGGSGGPTTTVTTNESNRGQAYQTINPQFEQGLGRQVTADELTEFRDMLNKFERENPYITNSGKGYSKTTGGFNPAELSKAFVQGQEGYAESQVAMNFMGVLDKILKNPDSLGETLQERMN